MSVLPIIKYPNKILEQKAKKVKDPLDPKITGLIEKMIETLKAEAEGIGLAAPQVGESLRLCVIRDGDDFKVLINPQITQISRKKILEQEGCLSFPGVFLPIKRAESIKIRFLDSLGKKGKMKEEGLMARLLQHEIDHLNGILIIERNKK